MVKRSDGKATRSRILTATQLLGAEHGFRGLTTSMIAEQADCKPAAINYYFGSKDELFAEVWQYSFESAIAQYPVDGGVGATAPAAERLRGFIHTRLRFLLGGSVHTSAGRLLMRELVQPSPGLDQLRAQAIGRIQAYLRELIIELTDQTLSVQQQDFCLMSIVHQILMCGLQRDASQLPPLLQPQRWDDRRIEQLAEHITIFSLAGIMAVVGRDEHV